jgi:uncharacterized protein YllA (UPF0747 family)
VSGGIEPQAAVPRWSATLVERRVDKVMERYGLDVAAFAEAPGALEGRLVREALPTEIVDAFGALRGGIDAGYERLERLLGAVDPTLERAVQAARNSAQGGTRDVEKKLVAALKRANETLVGQVARARTALFPAGQPQERVFTYASFAIRYGPALLDALEDEVARWAGAS